jgi:hypothetical protein
MKAYEATYRSEPDKGALSREVKVIVAAQSLRHAAEKAAAADGQKYGIGDKGELIRVTLTDTLII